MHRPSPAWPVGDVCWRCQWHLARSSMRATSSPFARAAAARHTPTRASPARGTRAMHGSASAVARATTESPALRTDAPLDPAVLDPSRPVRSRLKLWQQLYGGPNQEQLLAFDNYTPGSSDGDMSNGQASQSWAGTSPDTAAAAREAEQRDNDLWNSYGGQVDGVDNIMAPDANFRMGDVIELTQIGYEPIVAVFVQSLPSGAQFYSTKARWVHAGYTSARFCIPGAIDPALVEPILPYLPSADIAEKDIDFTITVPHHLSDPLVQTLERLARQAETIYRQNAPRLDNAYASLADDSRDRTMTLTKIAKALLSPADPTWSPSAAHLLAVRKAIGHHPFRFRSDIRIGRTTNLFSIRARNDAEMAELVNDWVRQYRAYQASLAQGLPGVSPNVSMGALHINSFLEKARRLVSRSRKYRSPLFGGVGLSKIHSPGATSQTQLGEEFSSTDKQILAFLQAWVLSSSFNNTPAYWSACSTILHATECYLHPYKESEFHVNPHQLKRATGFLFLQELGVVSPHDNPIYYDEILALPTVRSSRNMNLLNTKAEAVRQNPDFRDSMAELRHDWGNMDVYCVDSASTTEVDDGFSIERVAGTPSEFWVHVHVANPTAFFDKTHVLSGLAAHTGTSLYAAERVYRMLPQWATDEYFSLQADRPTLTFSARVDTSGNILETRIQSGIVRNVTRLTPAQLEDIVGKTDRVKESRFVVGGDITPWSSHSSLQLSAKQLQDLHDVTTVARARWAKRKQDGYVSVSRPGSLCEIFEKENQRGLSWAPPSMDRSRLIHGEPIIAVTSWSSSHHDNRVRLNHEMATDEVVAEMMTLACAIAGDFSADRNLPSLFRGTIHNSHIGVKDPQQFEQDFVRPYMSEHDGTLPLGLALLWLGTRGRTVSQAAPLRHDIIALPNYIRATSPMRRFNDMIAHWQIEAALRYEARTGRKFDGTAISEQRAYLPFTTRQIEESIATTGPMSLLARTAVGRSEDHWKLQAYSRAFYGKETELPEIFTVEIVREAAGFGWGRYAMGMNYHTMFKTFVERRPDVEMRLGDIWECRIRSIEVYEKVMLMEPISLKYREHDLDLSSWLPDASRERK